MLAGALSFVSFVAFVSAAGPLAHVLRDSRSLPSGFTHVGPAPKTQVLNLRLGMVQSDPAGIEKALMAVSTPSSPSYGKHLSKEEAFSYLSPKPETVAVVSAWLKANGIETKPVSPAGDWQSFSITVEKASTLFNAPLAVYKHTESGIETVRALEYSIPASLQGHLDFIFPMVTFPQIKPQGSTSIQHARSNLTAAAVPTSCNSQITPACLQALYGIPATAATQASNKLFVSGYIDQYANKADLKSFLTKYRTDISSATTFTLAAIDGGLDTQSSPGIEANLDIQYTIGVATGVPTTFLTVGDSVHDSTDGFQDTLTYLSGLSPVPTVLTTSYAFNEGDLTASVETNLCNQYASVGAMGVSIFFASGDGGVSGGQSQSCTNFIATFPSVCPYVTSVGGTTGTTEVVASFTGGGFSKNFAAPSYQTSVVATYLAAQGTTYSGKFNAKGRGFPDVSAQASNYVIYNGGGAENVSGTSCATPMFASVIALINDRLIAAGKSPLGFLNPWLYSTAKSALHDVTSGSNPGCNTNGFSARAGWDPATGLGTPIFASLVTAAGL